MENELKGTIGLDMNPPLHTKEKQIEAIAWQLFLNESGLRFKNTLTEQSKLGILNSKECETYRQKAEKIYEKKQKALLLNKKYLVIDVPASGKRGWSGGTYTLCFVYSKYKGNFVLKGYYKEVQEYLKKNYTHYFYNMSLWHCGLNRDIWGFWKPDIGIFKPSPREKRRGEKKIEVRTYSNWLRDETNEELSFKFKRMPKRWIPEFDKF